MDGMLWILAGLGGGLLVAALMPEMGAFTRSTTMRRHVRAMGGGVVGAVIGGYALVLTHPSLRADRVAGGLAAFAGALWTAGIIQVYASRRRRGEPDALAALAVHGKPSAREMPMYDAAREALVAGLLEDAAKHDAGLYADIGHGIQEVHAAIDRQNPSGTLRLRMALQFWQGWADACGGGVLLTSPAGADWPRIARVLAGDLALDRDSRDPLVLAGSGHVAPAVPAAAQPRVDGVGA